MEKKEYQNIDLEIILFSEDVVRTSGDGDETERIPFEDALPSFGIF